MKLKLKRELKNSLILSAIFNILLISGLACIIQISFAEDTFDLSDYDAESNILGFIPYADSGLKHMFINQYPMRELIANYEGVKDPYKAKTRILFKIGEWDLKENLTKRQEFTYGDQKLIISTYYLETDLIAWTDLDYDDVFTDGSNNYKYEVENDFKWLEVNQRHNYGWDPFHLNSLTRISIWNDELYRIVKKYGKNEILDWDFIYYSTHKTSLYNQYPNLGGLQELAKKESCWKKEYYEKYLRWNQLNLPGYDGNVRNWANDRIKDFKISGDLYFEVNVKESLISKLNFPEEVKGENGDFELNKVIFCIDDCLTLGANEPGSRTGLTDLQELYDKNKKYSDHSAEGNFLATNPQTEGEEVKDNCIMDTLKDYIDNDKALDEVPDDNLGDGYDITGVVDEVAKWNWEEQQYIVGSEAELPGTATLSPYIWADDENNKTKVSEQDLKNLKPLDKVEATENFMNMKFKDRHYAIFKSKIEFAPKLIIDYAKLNVRQVKLNLYLDLWGNPCSDHSITTHRMVEHVPYGANVHNMGLRQTLRLKFLTLSTYDYIPHQAEDKGEVAPGFPMDDTEKQWPETVDDGGEVAFTKWTETYNPLDAFLGFLMNLGKMLFNDFWWLIIPLIIGIAAIGGWLIIKIIRGFFPKGGLKKTAKKMDKLMQQQMELQRLKNLNQRNKKGVIAHIEGVKAMKYSRAILIVNTGFSVFVVFFGLYLIFGLAA
ncbi:MAG: hypothetical protein ACTSRP_10465 [Candidatus Helarchaeota archaeon]